jgi:uncharacterized membrane protein
MKLLRSDLGALVALAVSFGASVWGASRLPEQVATHWGLDGQPNGWMSRSAVLVGGPLVGLAVTALVRFAGSFWPKRMGLQGQRVLPLASWLTATLFAGLHGLVVFGGSSPGFSIERGLFALLGGFFVALGLLAPRLPQNPFIGIRTPWTLASTEVWARTHRLGGATMTASGLVVLAAVLAGVADGPLFLAAVLVGVGVPAGYSMLLGRSLRDAG